MSERTTNAPKMHRMITLPALFASAAAYAFLLNTRMGKRWEGEHTWATVVVGVLMTLGWLTIEDDECASKCFLYFTIAGIPIIFRALWVQSAMIDSLTKEVSNGTQA